MTQPTDAGEDHDVPQSGPVERAEDSILRPVETSDASSELLVRLSTHRRSDVRYEQLGEIARGGMGAILRVRDQDLKRNLAMKIALGPGDAVGGSSRDLPPKTLGRFLEEAQVTGQLDHPGVVPVHELGIDDQERIYFTMRLVKGRDLQEVFDLVQEGKEGWTTTRALWVLLKMCDAMAYAHSKQVVHRDLKPANVMVGRFGEVYVMDWGLARVLGTEDKHDLRLRTEPQFTRSIVESERRKEAHASDDSLLYTMDGDVVGTPAYMAPEQARGEIENLGPRSDVYSAGAMLYHLLAGEPPYTPGGARVSQHMILRWVLESPPRPLHEIAPDAPAELAAICEKAMARDPADRYADMEELAEDLRAYLEHRVVRAYETGAVAEFRKWVHRNRALAAASIAAVLLALIGLGAVSYVQARGRRVAEAERERAEENERIANDNLVEVRRQEQIARRERANVLRLSAFRELENLTAETAFLWPIRSDLGPELEAWLRRAVGLVAGLSPSASGEDAGHYRRLEELRRRALPVEAGAQLGEQSFRFANDDDAWWHDQLVKLVRGIEAFADSETGSIEGSSPEHGWGIKRRQTALRRLAALAVDDEAERSWERASASIGDVDACPEYAGLQISPQYGLVPIRRDEDTGLWEFLHVLSGTAPVIGADGRYRLDDETGIILVLLPGGSFFLGASTRDGSFNFDPRAKPDEGPVVKVELDPFFISRYELTQGQWERLFAARPSRFAAGSRMGERAITDRNPVERVSWDEATTKLAWFGLQLPTEAQWEYAARAGEEHPWWTGPEAEDLEGAANLNDLYARRHQAPWEHTCEWLDDGHLVHAPVGTFEPNAFGLHDVHGNVYEWCVDGYLPYNLGVVEGTGELRGEVGNTRIVRGGAFTTDASLARSGSRDDAATDLRAESVGLRPARRLDP